MSLARNMEKCPYCREPIIAGATRCRHCHAELSENNDQKSFWSRYDRFRTGFLCGILFSLVIAVLAFFHFSAGN